MSAGSAARGTDEDPAARAAHEGLRERTNFLGCDGTDAFELLGDRGELAVHELGLAEATHAGPGVLHAEHETSAELTCSTSELGRRDGFGGHALELGDEELADLVDLARRARCIEPEQAGIG